MPYIGKCDCQQCGREVDAYVNVRGMAYYNCGPCGVRVQQKNERGNRKFLENVRRDADEEAPDDTRKLQEIPEPAPDKKQPEKPVKRGVFANSIFGG